MTSHETSRGEGAPKDGADHRQDPAYVAGRDVYLAGRDQHFHFAPGVRRAAADEDSAATGCPYPGLAAFTAEQAGLFFGRDHLTSDLLGRLNAHLTEGGPVMVVGDSGAGKSSLLRAGLLHRVSAGGLTPPGSHRWPLIVFTPGAHPMREAATALLTARPENHGGMPCSTFSPDPADLDDLLRQAVDTADSQARPTARAVIVVDQFEELFTLCDSEPERVAFVSWLWRIASRDAPGGPLALVACGLRADFYGECARYPQIRQALMADQVLVGPMSTGELLEAIVYPARAAGLDVEPGLAEILLRDLGIAAPDDAGAGVGSNYDAGRLPLLAHALQAAWQQRHGSLLTVDGYQATGGIRHALAATAERAFSQLDSVAQQDARTVFLRLVRIGDIGEDTRLRVSRESLLRCGSKPDVAQAVLGAFTCCRLLTQHRAAVEITHEALIRGWPRLRQWIDQDRAGHLVRQDLSEASSAWDDARQDPATLYRGGVLEAAQAWADSHQMDITPVMHEFLAASRHFQRRAAARRRAAITAVAVLTAASAITGGVAFKIHGDAVAAHNAAIISQVTTEAGQLTATDPSLAAQLDLVANQAAPAPANMIRLVNAAASPLSSTLGGPTTPVYTAAFSPDAHMLAAGTGDGSVWLWNTSDPAQPVRLGQRLADPPGPVSSVAFSPNGRMLAAISSDSSVCLWDIADLNHPDRIRPPSYNGDQTVPSGWVGFSPNGRTLAAADGDGQIWLWNTSDPAHPAQLDQPLTGPKNPVTSAAFSLDGHTFAAVGDGQIWLWNTSDPAHPAQFAQRLIDPGSAAWSVAFSPDGHTLAAGDGDGGVWLWNIANPLRPARLGSAHASPASAASSVTFSPDGHTLAAGDGDGKIWLWNIANPLRPTQLGSPLAGPARAVSSVTFSQDERTLAASDSTLTVQLWNLPSSVMTGPANAVSSVAFSPGSRTLAAGDGDGKIWLWNTSDPGRRDRVLTGPGNSVSSVAFRPDGRTLAAGDGDGKIWLWNTSDPAHPSLLNQLLIESGGTAWSVAFSPDGRTLAAGDGGGQIWLLNTADPGRPTPVGEPLANGPGNSDLGAAASQVAFSPDRRTVAIGGTDGNGAGAWLWDIARPANPARLRHPLASPASTAMSAAFSPDGRVLAIGGSDGNSGEVWLVNTADPANPVSLGFPLTGPAGFVSSVAFSPNGRTLAAGANDGSVWLWNTADPANPAALGSLTGSASDVSSVAFSPDGRTLAAGTGGGSIWLWDLDIDNAIQSVCTATGAPLTPAEWKQYIPQLPYYPPCVHPGHYGLLNH